MVRVAQFFDSQCILWDIIGWLLQLNWFVCHHHITNFVHDCAYVEGSDVQAYRWPREVDQKWPNLYNVEAGVLVVGSPEKHSPMASPWRDDDVKSGVLVVSSNKCLDQQRRVVNAAQLSKHRFYRPVRCVLWSPVVVQHRPTSQRLDHVAQRLVAHFVYCICKQWTKLYSFCVVFDIVR